MRYTKLVFAAHLHDFWDEILIHTWFGALSARTSRAVKKKTRTFSFFGWFSNGLSFVLQLFYFGNRVVILLSKPHSHLHANFISKLAKLTCETPSAVAFDSWPDQLVRYAPPSSSGEELGISSLVDPHRMVHMKHRNSNNGITGTYYKVFRRLTPPR